MIAGRGDRGEFDPSGGILNGLKKKESSLHF